MAFSEIVGIIKKKIAHTTSLLNLFLEILNETYGKPIFKLILSEFLYVLEAFQMVYSSSIREELWKYFWGILETYQ